MGNNLISRREAAMDRADQALDAAWPARNGAKYVQEMQWAINELKTLTAEMHRQNLNPVEQSRTWSYLGSVYSDLAPAQGSKMLLQAKDAYQKAEVLLKECSDDLMHAKLNFNLANTLRQMDPNDLAQLQEARRRLLSAKEVFVRQAPQFIQQVDSALKSVESLLKITPVLSKVEANLAEMERLEEELAEGDSLAETIQKIRALLKRDGGVPGLTGQVQNLINNLPDELRQSEQFEAIRRKLAGYSQLAAGNPEAQILNLLRERLETELQKKNVTADRAGTLRGLLGKLGTILSGTDEELSEMLEKLRKIHETAETRLEMLHYLSHGLPRPPAGSRAATLVEIFWQLRRFLAEEMNRPNKTPEESKTLIELHVSATRVDRRIYEAAENDLRAQQIEIDEMRPLALVVRSFSARSQAMLAQPIWSAVRSAVDTNAVFFAGAASRKKLVASICQETGLKLMPTPGGESIGSARWQQIQKAATAIFDFCETDTPGQTALAYELGIALTLGKPVVILTTSTSSLPFDVDIGPVVLTGEAGDHATLKNAIDYSLVWTYTKLSSNHIEATLKYILARYPRPASDTYTDQMLKLIANQQKNPDPESLNRLIAKFVDFLDDGRTMVIYPHWAPVYPSNRKRLFHVMPFRPGWANEAREIARQACTSVGAQYIRGDEMEDPNVIRSIWEEIARASHVLVDLTGLNANVALELGIAHTLGRPCLLLGQDQTVKELFPNIAKQRLEFYKTSNEIGPLVRDFLGKS